MKKIAYYIGFLFFGISIFFFFPSNSKLKLNEDSTAVLGNLQPIEQQQRLFNLKWQDELSSADIGFVQKSLATEYHFVADEALEVIGVHGLTSLVSNLANPDNKHIINHDFAEILKAGISKNKTSSGNYLAGQIKNLNVRNDIKTHGRKSTLDLLESVLITSQNKTVRKGRSYKIDMSEVRTSSLNQRLLEYSRQPKQEVITSIISGLRNAPNAAASQINKVEALRTYGYEAVKQAVSLISDKNAQNEITPNGRFLMFRFLTDQFVLLTEQDKNKLKEVLNSPLISNGYFAEPTSLMILARLMRERLSPGNYQPPTPNTIEAKEPANQKELDAIREAIEAEPRKEGFSRPEDRGESFREFSQNDVLDKLSSTDKIEQRKAAIELGDRYISGQLEVTKQEQETINAATQQYIDMASSEDVNVREEGKLQIHRLWQLSIPTLLENLHNENVAKMELAAKSLILMRNEEAIEGLIEKTNTASDPRNKERLLFVMSKMTEQRKTIIPNRECMDEAASQALFSRVLASEMKKYQNNNKK